MLLHIVPLCWVEHTVGNDKGGDKIRKKNSSIRNHVIHEHANKFSSFLAFLELRKTSQLDEAYELSTDYGSRNRRKSDKVIVGGRLSYYLLTCHPYGNNHPKHREFEVNVVALMANPLTSLLLVDHGFFGKLIQDLDPQLQHIGQSKLSRSLILT